ncbi:DNA-processing protein DprA [Streptomyces sp. NPDC060334]|uniref:DNA-processing protein DprA n=1 Tax=Streptomyces sp. NPDC060334 TaxID=3347099 RepID=UPI00366491D8
MVGSDHRERTAWVALLGHAPSRSSQRLLTRRAVGSGSSLAVLRTQLGQPTLLDDPVENALRAAQEHITAWERTGITVLTFDDADFPARLRTTHDMPGVLFGRGTMAPQEESVSVVGSRAASPFGLRTAGLLAHGLARDGITVVSGLASGIDASAHRGALAANGRTVGIIGTGIRHAHPEENRRLHSEVAAAGAVLSQFWPDTPPDRTTFPARNATMVGYAAATVVVEAGEHSGARIQAREAVEHGRPVLLMRPVLDRVSWAQQFLRCSDVHVAQDVDDALRTLREIIDRPKDPRRPYDSLADAR